MKSKLSFILGAAASILIGVLSSFPASANVIFTTTGDPLTQEILAYKTYYQHGK